MRVWLQTVSALQVLAIMVTISVYRDINSKGSFSKHAESTVHTFPPGSPKIFLTPKGKQQLSSSNNLGSDPMEPILLRFSLHPFPHLSTTCLATKSVHWFGMCPFRIISNVSSYFVAPLLPNCPHYGQLSTLVPEGSLLLPKSRTGRSPRHHFPTIFFRLQLASGRLTNLGMLCDIILK